MVLVLILANLVVSAGLYFLLLEPHFCVDLTPAIVIICTTLVDFIFLVRFLQKRRWKAALLLLALGILPYISFELTNRSHKWAYNDCVANSEKVRLELLKIRKATGRFPISLSQIEQETLCGKLPMQKSILRYETIGDDFSLMFEDPFISFSGTSTEEMHAQK